jgi:predicted RNA-binding protein with RPS1 domain
VEKVELSVKQALAEGQTLTPRPQNTDDGGDRGGESRGGEGRDRDSRGSEGPRRESRASFEDKMGEFMRSSSERLGDLKRNIENKRGGKKTR